MKKAIALSLAAALALSGQPLRAQDREEARPRDLQRLQEELRNLDEDLQALDPRGPRTDAFQQRAEDLREEVVALKVKLRHQQQAGGEGTGISYDEVQDLRRAIGELRDDIERVVGRGGPDLEIREGSEVLLRLDESLSSRTARREDRFDASVAKPVRGAEGGLALAAGTRVRGIVRDAQPAQRASKGGRLDLDFDVVFLERSRLDLRSHVVAVYDQNDDRLDTREKAGLGAVLGGVIGSIIGGRRGAIAGMVIGAGGAVAATKGEEIDLPAGTLVRIRLDRPLIIPPK